MMLKENSIHLNPPEEEALFRSLMGENLRRGLLLAYVVIVSETVFAAIDVCSLYLKINQSFHYKAYLAMYLLMLIVCGVYLIAIKRFGIPSDKPIQRVRRLHFMMITYITFVMVWGSVITLMDQALYGQLIVFVINTLACSVMYAMNARSFSVPYVLSCAVLLIGLPFAQHSSDVLVGHYVNLCFFIVFCWIASRMLYRYYCSDFINKIKLQQANHQLQNTVIECERLNEKLVHANGQLKEASMLDDLTGIANRRSFRVFIDHTLTVLPMEGICFSVMMIDIDFFKQYNDQYGHVQGDEVLKAVAATIDGCVDFSVQHVVRWGGEEFLCAVFHEPEEDVIQIANKIQTAIQDLGIPHPNSKASKILSISMGCSAVNVLHRSDISTCIEQADQALYKAKSSGRNRCCLYENVENSSIKA